MNEKVVNLNGKIIIKNYLEINENQKVLQDFKFQDKTGEITIIVKLKNGISSSISKNEIENEIKEREYINNKLEENEFYSLKNLKTSVITNSYLYQSRLFLLLDSHSTISKIKINENNKSKFEFFNRNEVELCDYSLVNLGNFKNFQEIN